jgi:hypothetical protein
MANHEVHDDIPDSAQRLVGNLSIFHDCKIAAYAAVRFIGMAAVRFIGMMGYLYSYPEIACISFRRHGYTMEQNSAKNFGL